MTIGYGAGPGSNVHPFSIYMGEENETEVGFFKFFLCKESTAHLYSIQQEESIFQRSQGMRTFLPMRPNFDDIPRGWGPITVTVIQRRPLRALRVLN